MVIYIGVLRNFGLHALMKIMDYNKRKGSMAVASSVDLIATRKKVDNQKKTPHHFLNTILYIYNYTLFENTYF